MRGLFVPTVRSPMVAELELALAGVRSYAERHPDETRIVRQTVDICLEGLPACEVKLGEGRCLQPLEARMNDRVHSKG